jgi:hypothetical protein
MLENYSRGNFENDGSKTVANIGAGLLRLKGFHSGLMGATRTAGMYGGFAGRSLGNSNNGIARMTGRKLSSFSGEIRPGGSADKFLSGLSPERLIFKGGKLAGKGLGHLAKLPINAATGTGEYFRLGYRIEKASRAAGGGIAGAKAGWSTFGAGMAGMRHDFAPMLAAGLAVGGARAFVKNYHPQQGDGYLSDPRSWSETRYTMPGMGGPHGSVGSIDPSNFPGGITVGRGRSAIRSQTVMEGQMAVTSKMVTRRRV